MKDIYLAGHSTGCQKSIYWAYKKKSHEVRGIILLAPIADYAGMSEVERGLQPKATRIARTIVPAGKPHELLPAHMWSMPVDAQRFLSLYTPDSIEQSIFSYFDPSKTPRILRSVRVPILVLLAEKDEYADRQAEEIATWFATNHRSHRFDAHIIRDVEHGFKDGERTVAKRIRAFIGE